MGDTGDNIIITGAFTNWTSATVLTFDDPNIVLTNPATLNNSLTSETAIINVRRGHWQSAFTR